MLSGASGSSGGERGDSAHHLRTWRALGGLDQGGPWAAVRAQQHASTQRGGVRRADAARGAPHSTRSPLGAARATQLLCRVASWQGILSAPQRPRDFHKRSYADANPLEEGELRGGKSRKSNSKNRAKALQPGRLVFLADHLRTRGAHTMHPHVVVSSGPQRLGGARQATSCVVVRPLPEGASLPVSTHAVSDVVGLAVDFEHTWLELVTPDSQLEAAMLQALEMHRMRCEPPLAETAAWKDLAPGLAPPSRL